MVNLMVQLVAQTENKNIKHSEEIKKLSQLMQMQRADDSYL